MQTKTTTLLLIFLAFQLEYAPAQIFQYSEQKGIWNEFTDALWLNDSTFVASEVIMSGGLTTASLSAFNPAGEIIWTLATPDTLEIMAYHSLIDLSDTTFAVLGYYQQCCDCSSPEPFVELRNKLDGVLINRAAQVIHSPMNNSPFLENAGNVAKTSSGFAVLKIGWPGSKVYVFSNLGDSIHSFNVDNSYTRLVSFQGDLVLSSENALTRITTEGFDVDIVVTEETPMTIAANDERIALVYANEIKLYDQNLDFVSNQTYSGESIFVDALPEGFALYNGDSILRLLNDGDVVDEANYFGIDGFSAGKLIARGENLILAGSKVSMPYGISNTSHRYSALRATDFEGGVQSWNADLEITDLVIQEYSITTPSNPSVPMINYSLNALVTVKNNGSHPVESFHLNYVREIPVKLCTPPIYNIYNSQEIPVGESVTLNYNGILGTSYTNNSDSIVLGACVFATHPNADLDIVLENDSRCSSLSVPLSVSHRNLSTLFKVNPNPAQNEIWVDTELTIEYYDIHNSLGQSVGRGKLNEGGTINIRNLPNGLYILNFQTDKGVGSKRLIITR